MRSLIVQRRREVKIYWESHDLLRRGNWVVLVRELFAHLSWLWKGNFYQEVICVVSG
jgi:hypothetical protein